MATISSLLPLVRKYFEDDPIQAAHSLETLNEDEVVEVLNSLPSNVSAEVIQHLHEPFAARVLQRTSRELFKSIVEKLSAQQGAAIFMQLPEDSRKRFLTALGERKKRDIQALLTYPKNSAGQIMTADFLVFHSDVKVKAAIQKLKQLAQKGSPSSYVYVVDRRNRLVGVMNMRDMMFADEDAVLDTVKRGDVFSINCFTDREYVANEISARQYFVVPVVDNDNRLLGVIRAEDLIEDVQEEATEDIQKMFGAGGDERPFSSVGFSMKKRLPWLHVNLATAFLAAVVVGMFETILEKVTILAVFLPVVAGQGGNAGAQSLAVVMRGLVMREIPKEKVFKLIGKETFTGAMHGIIIGVITATVTWLWKGNPMLGLVIGLGMLVNLTIAGLAGAAIPLGMKAIGLDPAQCSNIILTTITDVVGFFAFLGFAVLFQAYLI